MSRGGGAISANPEIPSKISGSDGACWKNGKTDDDQDYDDPLVIGKSIGFGIEKMVS